MWVGGGVWVCSCLSVCVCLGAIESGWLGWCVQVCLYGCMGGDVGYVGECLGWCLVWLVWVGGFMCGWEWHGVGMGANEFIILFHNYIQLF